MGSKYKSFLRVCLLLKKGYSYFEAQVSMCDKAYTYDINLPNVLLV